MTDENRKTRKARGIEDLARDIAKDPIRFAAIVVYRYEMFRESPIEQVYVAECKRKTFVRGGIDCSAVIPDYYDLLRCSGFGLSSDRVFNKKDYEMHLRSNEFANLKMLLDREGVSIVNDGRLTNTPEGASLFNNDPALCAKEWAETYRFVKKEELTKKD